jgi:hypothetical protein
MTGKPHIMNLKKAIFCLMLSLSVSQFVAASSPAAQAALLQTVPRHALVRLMTFCHNPKNIFSQLRRWVDKKALSAIFGLAFS